MYFLQQHLLGQDGHDRQPHKQVWHGSLDLIRSAFSVLQLWIAKLVNVLTPCTYFIGSFSHLCSCFSTYLKLFLLLSVTKHVKLSVHFLTAVVMYCRKYNWIPFLRRKVFLELPIEMSYLFRCSVFLGTRSVRWWK